MSAMPIRSIFMPFNLLIKNFNFFSRKKSWMNHVLRVFLLCMFLWIVKCARVNYRWILIIKNGMAYRHRMFRGLTLKIENDNTNHQPTDQPATQQSAPRPTNQLSNYHLINKLNHNQFFIFYVVYRTVLYFRFNKHRHRNLTALNETLFLSLCVSFSIHLNSLAHKQLLSLSH